MKKKFDEIKEKLEQYPILDVGILAHAFTPYMRDYFLVIEAPWVGPAAGRYRYTFTHCVECQVQTRVKAATWKVSWTDVFIDYQKWETEGEPEGFVWGVNWSNAYPGWELIEDSDRAKKWSADLGKEFCEVAIETEAFYLSLIFHDVQIEKLNDKVDFMHKVHIPLE